MHSAADWVGGSRGKALACALCAALLLCVGWLLFWRLGEMHIVDYDEARHGVSAYEMLRSGDYLVHTYQGEPDYWNLKPPLSFWSIALSYRIFGFNAFALRFYSALSALLAAIALTVWVWRNCGCWAALLPPLVFAANAGIYANHFARFGDADAQYQLFFTLAMLCMLASGRGFGWLYGSALFFGLAFLDKGTHAATIPAVCLFYMLCTGRLKELSWKQILLLALAGAAFVVPWLAARYLRDGTAFFEGMLATDVADRLNAAAVASDLNTPALLYYLKMLFRFPAMAVCLALCVLSAAILPSGRAKLGRARRDALIGCALWFALPIALYSLTGAKFSWYVYSGLMSMPVLTALLLSSAYSGGAWKSGLCVLTGVAVVCFGLFAIQNAFKITPISFSHTTQEFLRESLDRDIDAEKHAYIQYAAAEGENGRPKTEWMQADVLTALYCGDVVCKDGGIEAFRKDEEYAILFVVRQGNEDSVNPLLEEYPVRNEGYYLLAFDN